VGPRAGLDMVSKRKIPNPRGESNPDYPIVQFVASRYIEEHMATATTETVTCYKTDPSSCQGGCPTINKIATVLTTAKFWSRVPEGLNANMDGLTDRRLQSNPDSDYMHVYIYC